MDKITYALLRKYIDNSLAGAGAVKGVPCQIQSIESIEGGNEVTFFWEDNEGNTHTSPMDVMNGAKGVKGDKGDTGAKGDKGDKGDTGATGAKGDKGDKGETGLQGVAGPAGAQGVQGAKGDKGDDGYPFLIYKQYDDISEYSSSDFPEIGLMFMVMTYVQDQGYPIYRYTGEGTPDYSLVTYLASEAIKGDKGDKGDTGAQGPQGIQGIQGEKGDKGDKGDTGATGTKGETGAQGPKGDKGDKGDTGAAGADGAKGDKGDKGDTGEGVPTGGTAGQVLAKSSDTDYATEWINPPSGGKQTTIIDLSESNVVLDESLTDTVTVTYSGAAATFTSSDTSVATVDVTSASAVGNTYTYVITITAKKEGACSIEVDVPENSSYYGAKAYINVTVAISIYGAEWDGSSSPAWTRTDMATNFVDPVPYYSGMSGTPSSPFDNIMPWAGLRRVEDAEAGSLVEIPKFYYKWTRSGSAMKLQISMKPFTGSHVSPAHADRGDGVGERDYVYVGRYKCASDYKSKAGVTPQSGSKSANRTGIHSLGSNIWVRDFAMQWTIWMLYLVEYASWDSQSKIGIGTSVTQNVDMNMGYTDSMPYHTGTDRTARNIRGGEQYRYIEGLWDNGYEIVDGIYKDSQKKWYVIKKPSDFADLSNGVYIGKPSLDNAANSYIKSWSNPEAISGLEYALIPGVVVESSDASIYVTDIFLSYNVATSPLMFGGSAGATDATVGVMGLFRIMSYNDTSTPSGGNGTSRLMVLPANRLPS